MLCISIVAVVRNSHILRKKFSPEDMFTDFRERGRERERNTDQMPPSHALTQN